jgi:hypothetical protein
MFAGKSITSHQLSKLLQPFHILTMPVWVEGATVRGYKREQFEDAWARYLPPLQGGVRSVSTVRSGSSNHAAPNAPNSPNATPGTSNGSGRPFPQSQEPSKDSMNGSAPEGWNADEQMAALDEALRNREAPT